MADATDLSAPETPAAQQLPRCKTCQHWKYDAKKDHRATGICQPQDSDGGVMAMPFEVRLCRHPSKTLFERPVEKNGFGLTDASEYYAVLATAEDFGCVRHEPNT